MLPAACSLGPYILWLGYSDEKGAAGIYFRFIAVLNLYEWSSWKHVSFSDSFVCWWYCYVCDAVPVQACINSDLVLLSQWATTNGFRINKSKWQSMVLIRRYQRSQVSSAVNWRWLVKRSIKLLHIYKFIYSTVFIQHRIKGWQFLEHQLVERFEDQYN